MRPAFAISVDGSDITGRIARDLTSLVVEDAAGFESDSLTITIADPARRTEFPASGAKIRAAIGYDANLVDVGIYIVDKVGIVGSPRSLKIVASAANFRSELKSQQTRTWEGATVGAAVARIAAETGYRAVVHPDLAGLPVDPLFHAQTEESRLHWLTRLAEHLGATFKPGAEALILSPLGSDTDAAGAAVPAITIRERDVSDWSMDITDRPNYGSVRAYYWDRAANTRVELVEGAGEPVYTIRRPYEDAPTARTAARGRLAIVNRWSGEGRITMPGRPQIYAEAPLDLQDFDPALDGTWVCDRVTHRLDASGFASELDIKLPSA